MVNGQLYLFEIAFEGIFLFTLACVAITNAKMQYLKTAIQYSTLNLTKGLKEVNGDEESGLDDREGLLAVGEEGLCAASPD